MAGSAEHVDPPGIHALICVEGNAFDQFGRVLRHLCVGLVDLAINLRIAGADPRVESLQLGPIRTILHQEIRRPFARRRINRFLEMLAPQPPQLIHAVNQSGYVVACAAADAFDANLVLQVASLRDGAAALSQGTRRNAYYLATTAPLAEHLMEQGVDAGRVVLVRPGVLASAETACFRNPDRTPTLLCASPLERESGVDRLIDALGQLQENQQPVLAFLLGRGRQESHLRSLVRQRKLQRWVTFVHPLGDITQAFETADVFVIPAPCDAFHVASLQAMACGVAVVSAGAGVCDYIQNGGTAAVCQTPDAAAIAETLMQLLSDRPRATEMARAGQEYVRAHHTVSAMAEGVATMYREVAASHVTFSLRT